MTVWSCRGSGVRPAWYFVHWLFGTAAIILGWFNIFKGLDVYAGNWPVGGERKVSLWIFRGPVMNYHPYMLLSEVCISEDDMNCVVVNGRHRMCCGVSTSRS
jgi:hypothetical protein